MAGLDANGFTIKTFDEIREEINDSARSSFGQSIDVSDSSIIGRLFAIFAEREANLWELAEAVNAQTDPDSATGARLESLCALTGTTRLPATSSSVDLTLTGTPTTVVAAGSQASATSTGERFTTQEEVTIVATASWIAATAYALGDRVTNSSNVYVCTVAGTSAGAGGPTSEGDAIVDNTVTWRYLGDGTGDIDVEALSEDTGPIAGTAYDITTIETPISGWDSVVNIGDATLGTNIESDEDLRVRREAELSAPGTSPIDALRVDLLAVSDVDSVKLFVNNTDTTDGDGVPPHAVEALIQGGDEQDIYDQLLASVAAGIATYGSSSGTALDSEGNSHTMKFSRPTEIDIYVAITLDYDATLYPSDGDAQVKAAIVAAGDLQETGRDAVSSWVKAQAFTIPGVLDVSLAYIDTSPAPGSEATVTITSRQLAVYSTANISVTSSPATP